MTAESIALTNAVKYCGSGKGSHPGKQAGRQAGRQGVAEPKAPLFTPLFTTNNAATRKENCILYAYMQLHIACARVNIGKAARKALVCLTKVFGKQNRSTVALNHRPSHPF